MDWRVAPPRFARTRFDYGQVALTGESLGVNLSGHAEDAEKFQAALRQERLGERLDESGKLVGYLVVDEDDLVVRVVRASIRRCSSG